MKNLTALFLLMVLATIGRSQHTCPSDALNDSLLTHDPEFSRSFYYMERVLGLNRNLHPSQRTDELYTIPVVVHIIHTGEAYGTGTNITDEQVFSAIEALNEDFRRMPGTNGYGNGADVNIEFCLAARTPTGQPTNGIVRVNGSSVANYASMGIEASSGSGAVEESVKALSTWPRASYLNVWVVNEIENNNGGSGIQGYAYFPVNSPVDGIVVLYNAFGTVGNLKSYTNMNRTLTHEVGHYLGLYHTFNGTSACGAETNCNTQGDRVCDTPPTIQAGSCSSPACGGTQQVANYMDYTSQTCQDMFSEGQKLRMRTTLETQRTSILTSMGCMPVYQNDIGITAILSPIGTNCSGGTEASVTLANFGGNTLTSATIFYNVDGVGSNTYNWTGSLSPGASTTVVLGTINPSGGNHTFYAWTGSPNGGTDENAANNQSTGTFGIISGSPAQMNVVLDYYGAETSWTITDANNVVMLTGGPYVNGQQGLQNITPVCLAAGCYTLTMNDVYGDGQGFTNGSFTLTSSTGQVLATGAGNWGDISINDFCITDTAPQGDAPAASFNIQDNTICRNVQNDYTSTSTNAPTSYSWSFEGGSPATSTAQNPQNITYANAGIYDVTLTVTNAFGSDTFVCTNCVTVQSDPTVTLTATQPGCGGQNNGSVTSAVTGTGPFTYAWNTGATTANLNNISAGTYSVTVTSSQGCSGQASTTLTAPGTMTITGSTQQITCFGANNGSITLSVSGGSGNKTYAWSNGATTASVNNLAAGNYTVTVSDAAGCSATATYTLTAPTAISVSGNVTMITCAGENDGSITVSATGGTGSKTFSWSNGAAGATASNLAAGNYTVTATDASGCTATQTFTITSPQAIVINGQADAVTCNGESNGHIEVTATGGTGTKSFNWSNGAIGTSIDGLAAGAYTVTVSDEAGCYQSQTFTVGSPAAIIITGNVDAISCFGGNDGSISVTASGGSGEKSFAWSNGAQGNINNGLASGSYTVTATDLAGCSVSATFQVDQPAALELNLSTFDIACGDEFGGAIIAPIGGTPGYNVVWSNGSNEYSANALTAGNHSVSLTDVNSCSISESFTITQTDNLIVQLEQQNVSCYGAGDGSLSATISGGDQNYEITWSNGGSGLNLQNLGQGTYQIYVMDGSGCSGSETVVIEEPAALTADIDATDISCFGANNGSALAIINGGTAPYQIGWNNGGENALIENLIAGDLTVNIVDANGCTAQASSSIEEPALLTVNVVVTGVESCEGNDGSAEIIISGGVPAYNVLWSDGSNGTALSGAASGVYNVTITDANGCSLNAQAAIDYECETVVPPTQLTMQYCNSIDVLLSGVLECDPIDGAGEYMWRVSTPTGTIIIDEFTTDNQLPMALIPDLDYSTTYVVGIKARVGDVWGPFGNYCSVVTEDMDLPVTGILAADCGVVIEQWGTSIHALTIDNAMNYEWHITGDNYDWTAFTATPELAVVEAMLLVPGITYTIEVRCALGAGIFTNWSDACTFSIAEAMVVVELTNAIDFLVYPNPSLGNEINLNWGEGMPENTTMFITLFDGSGKVVDRININTNAGFYRHIFNNVLPAGIYFLIVNCNDIRIEKKLIVN